MTDKAFVQQAQGLLEKNVAVPVTVRTIAAGKFRRYKDMAMWKQALRPDVGGKNIVDMFKTAGGVVASLALLRKIKPDVVFAKGGYVSLPVGYAAHLLHIPLVIHDSDARPGLTNRVLSRWATRIATGMPAENYQYKPTITHYTGVPVDAAFHVFDAEEQREAKRRYGVDEQRPLVVITGGGLGAKEINQAATVVAPHLLARGYSVYHVTGKGPFERVKAQVQETENYHVVPFVYEGFSGLYGAADVVVCRASATTLQELAAAARAAIIVPNSSLGDQLENARVYEQHQAARMLRDEALTEDPRVLEQAITDVLEDSAVRTALATGIAAYARPDAAAQVARLITEAKE